MNPCLRQLLCSVKPGDSTEELIAWSASLAAALQSTLLVVSVGEDRNTDLNALRAQLCVRTPAAARERCNVAEVVRVGNAAEEIVLAAREENADLVVLPAEHRPFLELTTLGTTTERVMGHSPCSVLVTPREHRPTAGQASCITM